MSKELYKTPEVVNKILDYILDDKIHYNIFDESIPDELKEQYQKDCERTKKILEKEDKSYKKLIDSIKLKLKELEQGQLDIDEYIVGIMKIAVDTRKQLKEKEKENVEKN